MRRLALALLSASALTLLPMASSLGHAELRSAEPGPKDVISQVPAELVARFTQDLRKGRTSLEVRDRDGQTVARGGKDPGRRRVQRAALPPLDPGTYEVRWVTFSAEDDEIARGRYRFTVEAPPATPSREPTTLDCPSPAPTSAAESTPPPASTDSSTADPTPAPALEASAQPTPFESAAPDASGAPPHPCSTAPPAEAPIETDVPAEESPSP